MKKVILTLALLAGVSAVKAQGTLGKGNTQLNLGLGFSGWGVPVIAGLDFGLSNNFTMGIEGSYRSYNYGYVGSDYKFSVIGIGVNANYHFNELLNLPEKLDIYGGATLGYFIFSKPSGYGGSSLSTIGLGGQAGLRYFFTNTVGVQIEFGGGSATSGGKIGATIKL